MLPRVMSEVTPGHDFTRVPLRSGPAVAPWSSGLAISRPGDASEREAERVAEHVVTGGSGLRSSASPPQISRSVFPAVAARQASAAPEQGPRGAARGVDEALRSPGVPLDERTRGWMEPRFGRSFADVRVHTGFVGERSVRALGAEAYTMGNDIVFGSGRFAPGTGAGRRLLAHELAHVVQQGGGTGGKGIQRKEVDGLKNPMQNPASPQDWYSQDRDEWEEASRNGMEANLTPTNSFMRAAWYNTVNVLPAEYHTINERHDYYDLISYVIQHDPNTPPAARDVRFFDATNAVTGSPGIGTTDTPMGALKLGADTRQILREVNTELFALNVGVIRNLLTTWKEPRDPQTPAGKISAFDFDIRMVETEQGLVESYVAKNKARFTPAVTGEINASMDPTRFGQSLNFSKRSFEWAIKALGVPALDFTIRDHRQAIGFASVHIFHRKSEAEYLAFMKTRVPGARPATQPPAGKP